MPGYIRSHLRLKLSDATWKGHFLLTAAEVDAVLTDLDEAESVGDGFTDLSRPPFNVWRLAGQPTSEPHELQSRQPELYRSPWQSPFASDNEAKLFRHYVTHIANLMMPFEDVRNPWKTLYPASAVQQQSREQKAMAKAMFSQAAFNLAHLGHSTEVLLALGSNYYQAAIRELRHSCSKRANCGDFIAAVLTVMMANVSGNSFDLDT